MKLINSAERLANKTDEGLPPITASSDTTDFSSLAAMFNVNPAPANNLAGAPAPMAPPVHAPIGSQEWGQQVGESMVWAANQKLSEAQISLNPEHLGPLQIKLSLSGSDATVLFSAHNQLAADALQASSGQLKSMLAQAGFTQVNVDVSQQSGGNASGFSGQGYRQGPSTPNEASDDTRALASPVNASRISRSAIDAYA